MSALPATPPRVRLARQAGFAAWAALAVLQIVWHAWWVPPPQGSALLAAVVAVIPLLLPLLALHRPPRALLWTGIIALFYFCHGIMEAWTLPAARGPAALEILLSVIIVGALGAAVQKRPRKPRKPR